MSSTSTSVHDTDLPEQGLPAHPLLTVITVCLNRVGTIGAALDSVARQLSGDIEHLVIDGGSTDGTLDIVARYPDICVVSEPDKGLYDAMNKGVRRATGAYVCFLNSDDELADGVIEAVRPYLASGYDAVCVGTDIVERSPDGKTVIETLTAPDTIVLSPAAVSLGSPLLNAKFLRREFLQQVGEFDLQYKLAADVDLLLRAALQRPRLALLPIVGHHYLQHAGSLTINASGNNGRRAADECIAIAEATLSRADTPAHVKKLMRAWRGGKRLIIAIRERDPHERLSAWQKAATSFVDLFHYGTYLVRRKCRSPAERLLANVASESQSRQDVWLLRNIFRGRRNATFVEIGAYDGRSFSNCVLMEGVYGWSGIAIEANPQVFSQLKDRRLARCLNVAVGNTEGIVKFRIAGMLSGIVSAYDAEHRKRVMREFGNDQPENIVEVPMRSLRSILAEAGVTHVDYISIDVEGAETAIIESLAQAAVTVDAISLENNFLSKTLRRQVEALGMIKIHELEADDIYVREGLLSPLQIARHQATYLLSPRRFVMRILAPWAKAVLPAGARTHVQRLWQSIVGRAA